jgi:hypothetical protein
MVQSPTTVEHRFRLHRGPLQHGAETTPRLRQPSCTSRSARWAKRAQFRRFTRRETLSSTPSGLLIGRRQFHLGNVRFTGKCKSTLQPLAERPRSASNRRRSKWQSPVSVQASRHCVSPNNRRGLRNHEHCAVAKSRMGVPRAKGRCSDTMLLRRLLCDDRLD